MSSKQTIFCFGSNRNKTKLDLFRFCFDLFCETKKKIFRFVSVFQNRFGTNRNKKIRVLKQTETEDLCNGHGRECGHGHGHGQGHGHGHGQDVDMDVDVDKDVDVDVDVDIDVDMDTDLDMEMDTDSDMIFCFSSYRNKPKLDLFRFCFGLFRDSFM